MSVKDLAQSALAQIIAQHADHVVDVTIKGQTASGISDTTRNSSEPTVFADTGVVSGVVRVSSSLIDAPDKGETIYVDDNLVFVTQVNQDSAGAVITINYQNQRPVDIQ